MNKIYSLLAGTLFLLPGGLSAQSSYVPYDDQYYHWIDRLEIKSGRLSNEFHAFLKPFGRDEIARFADSFKISGHPIGFYDFTNLQYLQRDNAEWSGTESGIRKPILRYFYGNKIALFSRKSEEFSVYLNPILHLQTTRDAGLGEDLYTNTRGVELYGNISKKVGFYSYLTENQLRAPYYLRQYTAMTGVYPSAGLTKPFKGNGYDFFQARGYITFSPVKAIRMQFGHDRNFAGDGYRSFIFSDFGKEFLSLKINTRVWKFNYQNIFAEMVEEDFKPDAFTSPKKYVAFHHLSINLFKNLQVGLFETIVFDRTDSMGRNGGFELNYLNPIIFYRSVEHGLNSSDNALVGANFKWNIWRRMQFYGQMTLDEFMLKELRNRTGWWANKYAVQLGWKYMDAFFVKNMDLQYELNFARPYTFMHFKKSQNYVHYNNPIGHPLGANFIEHIAIARYRISPKLHLQVTAISSFKGLDPNNTINWGGNIYRKDYTGYPQEYGNKIGQGSMLRVGQVECYLGYQLAHRIWIEAIYHWRRSVSDLPVYNYTSHFMTLGFRMNMARPRNMF